MAYLGIGRRFRYMDTDTLVDLCEKAARLGYNRQVTDDLYDVIDDDGKHVACLVWFGERNVNRWSIIVKTKGADASDAKAHPSIVLDIAVEDEYLMQKIPDDLAE